MFLLGARGVRGRDRPGPGDHPLRVPAPGVRRPPRRRGPHQPPRQADPGRRPAPDARRAGRALGLVEDRGRRDRRQHGGDGGQRRHRGADRRFLDLRGRARGRHATSADVIDAVVKLESRLLVILDIDRLFGRLGG